MKKIIICFALSFIFIFVGRVHAQKDQDAFRFALGIDAGTTLGNFKNIYGLVPGLTLRGSYPIGPGAVTLTTGALVFLPKDANGDNLKAGLLIPVKAGYKLIVAKPFFVMGELGFSNFRQYFEVLNEVVSVSNTGFTYAPAVGLQLGGIELSARYEGTSFSGGSLSAALLRIGFHL